MPVPLTRPVGHPLPQGERGAVVCSQCLCATVFPSPLEGEGGPQDRMRGTGAMVRLTPHEAIYIDKRFGPEAYVLVRNG
jgi:hypothetical protein